MKRHPVMFGAVLALLSPAPPPSPPPGLIILLALVCTWLMVQGG